MEPGTRLTIYFVTIAEIGVANGPAIHCLNLSKYLAEKHDVTLISPWPRGTLPAASGPHLRLKPVGLPRLKRLPRAAQLPFVAAALCRLRRPDVIYLRSSIGTSALAAFTKRFLGCRLVVEFNGWLAGEVGHIGWGPGVARLVEKQQLGEARHADAIRVVTPELNILLIERGIPADRIHVIGNGSDLETFTPLNKQQCRAANGLEPDAKLLAVAGNLWPALDLATVFSAQARLRRDGMPIELLVVGQGIAESAFRKCAHEALGPDPPVHWYGQQPPTRVNQLLNAADAVLAPFVRASGLGGLAPLKIRDCAAAGRPCVATDVGGIGHLRHEPWVFLARPEDPEAFADAVRRALAANDNEMRHCARSYAEKHFDWKLVADSVAQLTCQPPSPQRPQAPR